MTAEKEKENALVATRVKFRADKSLRIKGKLRKARLPFLWAWLALLIVAALTTILISKAFFFQPYDFEIGKIVGKTIRAPFPFEVEDREAYNKKLEEASQKTPHCYEYDSSIEEKILKTIDGLQEEVINLSGVDKYSVSDVQRILKRRLGLALSDNVTTELLKIGNDYKFFNNLKYMIHEIMTNRGVIDDKYTYQTLERQQLVKVIPRTHLPPNSFVGNRLIEYPEEISSILYRTLNIYYTGARARYLSTAASLAEIFIQPNIHYRPDLTDLERKKIISQVQKVKYAFGRGDIIIGGAEKVNSFHASALSRLNDRIRTVNLTQALANFLLVLIIFGFVAMLVHKYKPELIFSASNVILISLPGLLALGLGRLLIQVLGENRLLAGYAFPAGVIGILAVVLLDARIGFILVSWGAFLCGFMFDMNFKVTALAFIGGATSVLSLYSVRERKEMLMAGFRLSLVNFLIIVIFEYIDDPTRELYVYARIGTWGLVNGVACAMIAFPALKFFEVFFNTVTDVRLLELTGIRQTLLAEMEEKAPGSYQHSLNVVKLAEPAAIAVGVNYLLVRAGAYYHDIGKTIKPKYYSENQSSPEDKKIYQNMTPHLAVLIIKKHIKEGVDLARKHGLPQAVIDFIPQHHGTCLIRYFYDQALKRHKEGKTNDPFREEDFRYPGPKPQNIETAIVMLADTVEATVTSKLSQAFLDQDDIRLIVHNSILIQFNDGQFDECNMTLRDLHTIEESFVKALLSRFHHRVSYPGERKPAEREEKKIESEDYR